MSFDPIAQDSAAQARAKVQQSAFAQRVMRAVRAASISNPRIAGLASGVTLTDNGATVPASVSTSNGYFLTGTTGAVAKGIWTITGGTPLVSSGNGSAGTKYRIYSAVIGTTGGNGGLNDGKQLNCWRVSAMLDGRYIALALLPTTFGYRLLVDGKYVSTTAQVLATTTGTTTQYLLVDLGSRGVHEITVEGQGTCGFAGAYVEATAKMWATNLSDAVWASWLGDSYVYGSAATALGDGLAPQLGDLLGMRMHASGSGGTGWNQTSTSVYRFDQRIANGDIALGGVTPDMIFLHASVNDRTRDASVVQTNALAGLRSARALYPNSPIIVFGCMTIPIGPLTGTTSITASEQAVQAAVTAFADPLTVFAPIVGDTIGPWLTGDGFSVTFTGALSATTSATLANAFTGSTATWTIIFSDGSTRTATLTNGSTSVSWTGAVTASPSAQIYLTTAGNSCQDIYYDGTHPNDYGCAALGRRYAQGAISALVAMFRPLGVLA